MKTCDIDGIAWHLDDEGLIQILKALPLSQEKRRGYGVYPYGGRQSLYQILPGKGDSRACPEPGAPARKEGVPGRDEVTRLRHTYP